MDAAEEAELPQWEGGSPFLILGWAAVCQLLLAGLRILSCAVTSPRGWLESCSSAPQQQKPALLWRCLPPMWTRYLFCLNWNAGVLLECHFPCSSSSPFLSAAGRRGKGGECCSRCGMFVRERLSCRCSSHQNYHTAPIKAHTLLCCPASVLPKRGVRVAVQHSAPCRRLPGRSQPRCFLGDEPPPPLQRADCCACAGGALPGGRGPLWGRSRSALWRRARGTPSSSMLPKGRSSLPPAATRPGVRGSEGTGRSWGEGRLLRRAGPLPSPSSRRLRALRPGGAAQPGCFARSSRVSAVGRKKSPSLERM